MLTTYDISNTNSQPIMAAALAWAANGYPVFPCKNTPDNEATHKAPHWNEVDLANGYLCATRDPALITKWWTRWPDALIGVEKMLIIDLDCHPGRPDGHLVVPDWRELSPVIIETWRGGHHLVFAWDETVASGTHPDFPGVEVRAAGWYGIVPPSPGYKWLDGSDLANLPPLPDQFRGWSGKRRPRSSSQPRGKQVYEPAPAWLVERCEREHLTLQPEIVAEAEDWIAELKRAYEIIPNNDLPWDEWSKRGAALYNATCGTEPGREIFVEWSAKSKKHDSNAVLERWRHWDRSPYTDIYPESVFHWAWEEAGDFWWRDDKPATNGPPTQETDSGVADAEYEPPSNLAFTRETEGKNKGKVIPTQKNIRIALRRLNIVVSYDTFAERMLMGDRTLDDAAMTRLWLDIDTKFGFRPYKDFFWDVVQDTARQNSFHPVRDYLDGLQWDSVERIDKWLITYCNAEDSPFVRAAGVIWLTAAVRRVRQPGCKFDEMLIFEDPTQGTEKSTALNELAVKDEWFTDTLPLNADAKRVIESIRGHWIIEAGELSGMRAADVESLKGMLSRRIDKARMSYDRLTTELARQCVFAGTTNHETYLKDTTGNRRFWPVRVGKFDIPALRRDRDQLWAEAAAREASGASIQLDPKLWSAAGVEQEERLVADPFVELLREQLDRFDSGKITSAAVWTILNKNAPSQFDNERMGNAMRAIGWRRPNQSGQINTGSGDDRKKAVGYVKGDAPWDEVTASRDHGMLCAMCGDDEDNELADLIDDMGFPGAVTIGELQEKVQPGTALDEFLRDRKNRNIIPHRLEKFGYIPISDPGSDDGTWRVNNRRTPIYAKSELSTEEQLAACEVCKKRVEDAAR